MTGHLFAAAPDKASLEAYLPASSLRITAIPKDDFAAKVPDLIAACTNDPVSYGWFAGEFKAAQRVRDIFKAKYQLDKSTQLSVAYWREDVPGHQSRVL